MEEARAAKVGHVFGPHRDRCNEGVAALKKIGALDVIFEKWVKSQVHAEAEEIVEVSEPMVIPACCHGGYGDIIASWLAGDVAETIGGEIGVKDKQFAMIETTQARIGKDSLVHLVKSRHGGVGPIWVNTIRVLVQEDDSKGCDAHFEVGNKTSIKLDESDKLCDVADQFRGRSHFDELVFGHGWSITVDAYINASNSKCLTKMCNFYKLRDRFCDWQTRS